MAYGHTFPKILLVAAILVTSGSLDVASAAKKKLTFEQAWAHCKAQLDKDKVYGTTLQGNERFIRGGACMKNLGYSL